MKKLFAVSLTALFAFFLHSQSNIQIYGFVGDSVSGEKIISCAVLEAGSDSRAITNTNGNYTVHVPPGNVVLVFSAVGYEKKAFSFYATKDTQINMALLYVTTMKNVKIVAEKAEDIAQTTQMGAISIPVETIKKIPALLGETDVLKVLQLLPGVKPGMEGTSGFYVRGGTPDQNLILLDGTPLYNVSHLYGFFSVFNTDALNHVELIKGGFPARYGGRLSSVLEINMKDGNMKRFKVNANLGFISSNATIEGPIIKDKLSFVVSARRSYIDLFYQPLYRAISFNQYAKQGYFFYDFNGKINYKPSKNDQISFSAYTGQDKFYNNIGPYRYLYDGVIYENLQKDELSWGNRLAALRWNHRINSRWFSTMLLNYTRYKYQVFKQVKESEEGDTGIVTTGSSQDFRSMVRDLGFKYEFDYSPNNKNAVKTGINVIYHRFSPGATAYSVQNPLSPKSIDSSYGSSMVRAVETGLFAENDMVINDRLKINYGLHYSQFFLKDKFYHSLQPRLSARYLIGKDWALKASLVKMQQYIHLLTNSTIGLPTDLWVPSVKQLAPETSYQGSIGIAKTLVKKYLFSVETYYKHLQGVLDYKNGSSFLNTYEQWFQKIESGKGRSYGLEVFLQKKVGKTTGWVSYTLSKTDRQFAGINNGERFPFKYDSRHNISVVFTYDIDSKYSIAGTWIFATGNAFTLPNIRYESIDQNGQKVEVESYQKRNQFRGADYHRMDVSLTRHYQKKYYTLNVNFGFYNLYSRKNPFYYNIGTDTYGNKVLYRVALFPVLPFFSFNFILK